MRRASTVVKASEVDPWKIRSRVELDHDHRYRRRLVLKAADGDSFLLDLAEATHLKHGDGLLLDDGGIVRVAGRPEPLLEIRAASADELARLAWHIGNRHVEVQIAGNVLRVRRDHVIEAMLRGLGAHVTPIEAPFAPERGAYAQHDHDDGHV